MAALLLLTGCTHYRNIGLKPPINPDYKPPIRAIIEMKSSSGFSKRGEILAWTPTGILFRPLRCDSDACKKQIPTQQLRLIKVVAPSSGKDGPSDLFVLGCVVGSVIVFGLTVFAITWSQMDIDPY
ncbi:MAG: hypothetical protein JRF33_20955 [Deltaproteobacteria bacterium]|nr:hypothetical protein [Deltaproteobacteria bacterium]